MTSARTRPKTLTFFKIPQWSKRARVLHPDGNGIVTIMSEQEGTKDRRRALGAAGEAAAARYLERQGFRVLEANVRCRLGELDLVAVDRGTIVFVEVKSNRGGRYGVPEEMITPSKQRRLTRLAVWYLQRRGWLGRSARFDVVAVDWDPAGTAIVRHFPDAFAASGGW